MPGIRGMREKHQSAFTYLRVRDINLLIIPFAKRGIDNRSKSMVNLRIDSKYATLTGRSESVVAGYRQELLQFKQLYISEQF